MSRATLTHGLVLFGLLVPTLTPSRARAQPFSDLGPTLGLPSQLSGPVGQSLSAGVTVADLDGDGDLDILANTPTLGLVAYLRGPQTFAIAQNLLPPANPSGEVFGHTLFDANGDGHLDIHVSRNDGDRLYLGSPGGFIDVTDTHLPNQGGWSASATAVDFDGDGDLDLFVAHYIDRIDFPAHRCFTNRILENDGRGRFTDITATTGIATTRGCSFSMLVFDADDDGDLDFLTVNDFAQFTGATELWLNQGPDPDGHWRFTEAAAERGLIAPLYAMGAAFGDLDQNGRPEIFLTNIGEPLLFERRPDLAFDNATTARNLFSRFAFDRHQVTWTARFEDLDGDGHLDILAAGGNLPASPFLGNSPEMGSLILMGGPDGWLSPLPFGLDLPRQGHSARDFELIDLDGDGRPEIVTIHVHGRISIFKNLGNAPPPTRLLLVPSTTGDNAAGAHISLTCGAITRTRDVTAGGDYGNADRGEVRLHFPSPCDTAGQVATGTVRWPSGFVQSIDATTGQTHTVAEPDWLTLSDTELTLDLTDHVGSTDTVSLGGRNITFAEPTAVSRRFTAAFDRPDPSAASRIDISVDGTPWNVHPRIAGDAPIITFSETPIVGRRHRLRVSFAGPTPEDAFVRIGVGNGDIPMEPLDANTLSAELVMPLSPGPTPLEVHTKQGILIHTADVHGAVSAFESEVVVRELQILASERHTRRVRFRARLFDANRHPSGLSPSSLGLLVDGVPTEPDTRSTELDAITLGIEHSRLEHGALLQLTVDSVPFFEAQRVVQFDATDALSSEISSTTSRCWFSEPQGRADGEDRLTALIQFNDQTGNRILDSSVQPSLDTIGMHVVPGGVTAAFGGWQVEFIAGDAPGLATLAAALPGMSSPITCGILLLEPPALPEPITHSTVVALSTVPQIGEVIVFRFWPWGPDRRSLGSGVPLNLDFSDNVSFTGPTYIGQGRYEATAIPHSAGPVTLQVKSADDRVIAALTLDEAGGPADPGPEPAPEEPPELVPDSAESADVIDGDAEEDAASDVLDIDAAEPSADTTVGGDTDAPTDAANDAITTPDPDPSVSEPDPPRADTGGSSGCAGSTGAPAPLLVLALFGLRLLRQACGSTRIRRMTRNKASAV